MWIMQGSGMFRPAVSKNKAAIPFKMNKWEKVSEL